MERFKQVYVYTVGVRQKKRLPLKGGFYGELDVSGGSTAVIKRKKIPLVT